MTVRWWTAGASWVLAMAALGGEPARIESCVPADAMAVYFSRPASDAAQTGGLASVEAIGRWLLALKTLGVIPQQGRVIADILGTLPLVAQRDFALVLLDITARPISPGVYRLKDMKSALVVESDGLAVEIDRRVRDLLATYTDATTGKVERVSAGGQPYFRLVDARLPEWAVAEWGNVDRFFVAAFGKGAFESVLAAMKSQAPQLGGDAWYVRAHRLCSARSSGIEVYVAVARIEKRLENVINQTAQSALKAMQLERADRALMSVGFDGRALHSECLLLERDGREHHQVLTGRDIAAPEVLAAVPEKASSFAAFRFDLGKAVRDGRAAYLQTQSPERRQRFARIWALVEEEFQFDVDAGLIDQLGDHLIVHSFPPHPLGIPVPGTIWIQIKGDRARVGKTVDAMMAAWRHYVDEPPEKLQDYLRLSPRVRQDADGLWYLQLGLLGPALAVTDGWIVISYSPEAVRQNLAHLKDRVLSTRSAP
ncbi:MAG: hypothetical protein HRF43_17860 [Phycisphaerae bacterium]|jgi:hypothetical protein